MLIRNALWLLLFFPLMTHSSAGAAEIELIGIARWPGDAHDLSHLDGTVADGIPRDRFGGISAIEYTGAGNRYFLLPDRGPLDGAVSFPCRFQIAEIVVDPHKTPAVTARLLETRLLHDAGGHNISGAAANIVDPSSKQFGRLDPEGIRRSPTGDIYISDEYGPGVYKFNEHGVAQDRLDVPKDFRIDHPNADPGQERQLNHSGRQPNKGFEGLALTPDGRYLVAIAQAPLIQDSTETENGKRRGAFVRLLVRDLEAGKSREWAYPLTSSKNGISEILAVSPTKFLVLERDGDAGIDARFKSIMLADAAEATDISGVKHLPANGRLEGVVPMHVEPWLNLLDDRFGLKGPHMPEKFEGLTFGPTLPDGSRLLVISVDNDFEPEVPTQLLVFAIPADRLP